MKIEYILFIVISLIFIKCKNESNQTEESGIVLKTVLKGSYSLPQVENVLQYQKDSIYYFLVEIKLINKTNYSREFITHSCSAGGNVVVDNKEISICINDCSMNVTEIIKLLPDKEFSLPVILQIKKESKVVDNKIRLGFLFLNPNDIDFKKSADIFIQSLDKLQNIVWSAPIILSSSISQPYEIK